MEFTFGYTILTVGTSVYGCYFVSCCLYIDHLFSTCAEIVQRLSTTKQNQVQTLFKDLIEYHLNILG